MQRDKELVGGPSSSAAPLVGPDKELWRHVQDTASSGRLSRETVWVIRFAYGTCTGLVAHRGRDPGSRRLLTKAVGRSRLGNQRGLCGKKKEPEVRRVYSRFVNKKPNCSHLGLPPRSEYEPPGQSWRAV